jgi:putative Mg2+ transporter-C (MgtC) family protein
MPVNLSWSDAALRLLLTVVAGLIIGFNRGEHGRPAGISTAESSGKLKPADAKS